jgi:hypothetical protein
VSFFLCYGFDEVFYNLCFDFGNLCFDGKSEKARFGSNLHRLVLEIFGFVFLIW